MSGSAIDYNTLSTIIYQFFHPDKDDNLATIVHFNKPGNYVDINLQRTFYIHFEAGGVSSYNNVNVLRFHASEGAQYAQCSCSFWYIASIHQKFQEEVFISDVDHLKELLRQYCSHLVTQLHPERGPTRMPVEPSDISPLMKHLTSYVMGFFAVRPGFPRNRIIYDKNFITIECPTTYTVFVSSEKQSINYNYIELHIIESFQTGKTFTEYELKYFNIGGKHVTSETIQSVHGVMDRLGEIFPHALFAASAGSEERIARLEAEMALVKQILEIP